PLTSIRDCRLWKVSDGFLDQGQVDLLCHLVEKSISLNPRFCFVVLDDLLGIGQICFHLANKIRSDAHRSHPNKGTVSNAEISDLPDFDKFVEHLLRKWRI